MSRLSGWQRLGLIITVCWVIGSLVGGRLYQRHNDQESVTAMMSLCTAFGKSFSQCWEQTASYRNIVSQPYWPPILLIAFVPVPLFWMFGWAAIKTTRWVRSGFAQ